MFDAERTSTNWPHDQPDALQALGVPMATLRTGRGMRIA
jgi:hypothetical protein